MRPVDWAAVTLLLLFGAGLRIIGISFGQLNPAYFPSYAPYGMTHEQLPIQPDEFFSVAIPVNMALRESWDPGFYEYPQFIVNTSHAIGTLTGVFDDLSFEPRHGRSLRVYAPFSLYVAMRMYSVIGGMLMIACAYAIGRMLGGRYAALLAGLLAATSFTLVQHAHYIKPGTLAGGWMMLSAWAAIASLHARAPSRAWLYILAGVGVGLAATTRYNAVSVALIIVPIGAILLYRHRTRQTRRAVALAWLAMPLVFCLGSPYILRDFDAFWQGFSYIVGQFTATGANVPDYFLVDAWLGLGYLLLYTALFAIGLPALICCLASLPAIRRPFLSVDDLLRDSRSLAVALIWLLLIAYALIALRTIRPGHSDNLLILILPFAAVLAGVGANWIRQRIPRPGVLVMPALCLLLIIQPLTLSLQAVKQFTQPDTRHIMLDWIHRRIPPGSRFMVNGAYNVPLDEAVYPNDISSRHYVDPLPSGADYDYMLYSDAKAFDVLRSYMVPPAVKSATRDYPQQLDAAYTRLATIQRPSWTGAESMMNMAAYWHNPTLILYCLNPASCAAVE